MLYRLIILVLVFVLSLPATGFCEDQKKPSSASARKRIDTVLGSYSLRDDFTTARSAGSVNGTAAEPGPGGPRVVTDTELKLSIADGKATFAGGKAAPVYGDPRLGYPAVTRVAGRMVLVKIKQSGGLHFRFGFDEDQSGSLDFCRIWGNGSSLYDYNSAQVGSYQLNQDLYLAAVLRTTGYMIFAKGGGTYSQWNLLRTTSADATATLYPAISNYNAVFTVDLIDDPLLSWLPSPLVSDGFSAWGTSNGLGHAEGVAGGLGAGGGGVAWTGTGWTAAGGVAKANPSVGANKTSDPGFGAAGDWSASASFVVGGGVATGTLTNDTLTNTAGQAAVVGTWYKLTATVTRTAGSVKLSMGGQTGNAITTNNTFYQTVRALTTDKPALVGTGFSGTVDNFTVEPITLAEMMALHQSSTPDVYSSVALTIANSHQAGLILNCDSTSNPQNFIQCFYHKTEGKVVLLKTLAGTATVLANVTATYSAGATLTVRKIGLSYYVFYNNVLIGSWVADAGIDAAILSNALHGMFSSNDNPSLDNYVCYATGTEGQCDIFNRFIQ